ncbi:MAG TPA: response regulator transcription factor [Dyadobacter sp.]|jgi:DNA-binding NarL/FixJ family response regulator|nr:response regulator transcription factor [Dyadobacter sp.]
MLRIAIIDDHFIYRKGLTHILRHNFPNLEVLERNSGPGVETALVHFVPHVIMIHLENIHEREGFMLAGKLKSLYPASPLVIYEENTNYTKALKGLRAKIDAYLDKNCSEQEFVKCINTVLEGKSYLCKSVQQHIIEQVIQRKIPLKTPGLLSLRESEIARLISDGERTSGIAMILGLKSSTVSTVKATIFAKLGVSNIVELRSKMAQLMED